VPLFLGLQVTPLDGRWFNSGVMILSRALIDPDDVSMPDSVENRLHGDQGFLNALRCVGERVASFLGAGLFSLTTAPLLCDVCRYKHKWSVFDLGYAFNYIGSFESVNSERRPFANATEAFVVHATTGLADSSLRGREEYIASVASSWRAQGR
jgi:hypothetical protein